MSLAPHQKIKFLNRPSHRATLNSLEGQVYDFISLGKSHEFRYVVLYQEGALYTSSGAIIKVYSENPNDPKWDLVRIYQATEHKRFQSDLKRSFPSTIVQRYDAVQYTVRWRKS